MDDTEFVEAFMSPTPGDLAKAGALVIAQADMIPQHFADVYISIAETGRVIQAFVSLAETVARLLNIRDDPAAREAFLAHINQQTLAQLDIDNPPPQGDAP